MIVMWIGEEQMEDSASKTSYRSYIDTNSAASPAAHKHLITADQSAYVHVRAHRASHHQSTRRAVSGSYT